MSGISRFFAGTLFVRVQGGSKERFLNLCGLKGIELWNIAFLENSLEAWMKIKDFWELRPIVRKTRVKVAVLKKSGLPFFVPRILQRAIFLLGAMLAVSFWVVSSFFLWEIKVNGNVSVTKDQWMTFLKDQNVRIGTRFQEISLSELEKEIRRTFPQIVWTSAKQNGTELIIDVKESDLEQDFVPKDQQEEVQDAYHLVSAFDGRILNMIVRSGVPKVKEGDEVKAGDLLVEGTVPIYAEDGSVRENLLVKADADVWIEHLVTLEDNVEWYYCEKEDTGREKKEYYLKKLL